MMTAFNRDVWAIMGMPLDNVTLEEAVRLVERAVESRQRLSFVTPNVNWMVRALKDEQAMRQIVNADLSLADGSPVVWLARQLGMPLKERVAGADLFDLLRKADPTLAPPIRVFFFGGREGAAQAAHDRLIEEQGRLVSVGWHNPGFGDVDSMTHEDIRARINAAEPDFIIVSLGAAKGQAWIEQNQAMLDAPVIAHLGAVVDFVAGSIRRAPSWSSRLGLEWIGRILAEPALWHRYWSDGLSLLGVVQKRLGKLKRASRITAPAKPVETAHIANAIKLRGDLVYANRDVLRHELNAIAQRPGDCALDLSEIGAIDASAMGQVRMLEQCLMRRGNRLQILSSTKTRPVLEAANMTL
ncbi:MAG: WecB/TagA/CpsF family glycosyltransferase [Pseudomonadota bacterium]